MKKTIYGILDSNNQKQDVESRIRIENLSCEMPLLLEVKDVCSTIEKSFRNTENTSQIQQQLSISIYLWSICIKSSAQI